MTAAALIRDALRADPNGLASSAVPPTHLPSEDLGEALNELRRAYMQELEHEVDSPAFREALRVLAAIEQVGRTIGRDGRPGDGASDRDPPAAPSPTIDLTSQFARHLAQLSQVSAIVSLAHDMRSPLTSILFLVEALRARGSGTISAAQDRQLGLVYSAAFGLSSMVNDVLLLARGEIGDREVSPFSISELIRSVKHIVEPIAEEKQLTVLLEFPELDDRLGYPVMLSRVLLNLVTNALKFTPRGTVTLAARDRGDTRVEFSVRDTGPGIPPEILPKLLDVFRQPATDDGRARRHIFSSAGLGLSICQTLVRAMHSELRVDSTLGEGTRFSFEVELPPSGAVALAT